MVRKYAKIGKCRPIRVTTMSKTNVSYKQDFKQRINKAITSFKSLDRQQQMIFVGIAAVVLIALIFMLKFMFARQPKSLDKYLADAPGVLEMNTDAGVISKAYLPLREQLGDAAYDKYVLGIPSNDPTPKSQEDIAADKKMEQLNNYQKSADVAKQFIQDVQTEQKTVAALGGVATIEQAQAMYNNNPKDPQLAARVRREMQEVKEVEQRFNGGMPTPAAQAMANPSTMPQPVTQAGQEPQPTTAANVYNSAVNDPQRAKEIAMQLYQ